MLAAEADGAEVDTIEGQANADGSLKRDSAGVFKITMGLQCGFLHTRYGYVCSGTLKRKC